ncbi:MAG: hypothetical protein MJZ03_00595 [archaeon]|nr:hypothetical protein [archaeon]
MGQRLVVNIEANDVTVASIYYHWSAYTMSALYTIRDIVNSLYDGGFDPENYTKEELMLRVLNMCEASGGCLSQIEYDGDPSIEASNFKKMFPNREYKTSGSRDDGIVAFTDIGIGYQNGWAEGTATIDLSNNIIEFDVYSEFDSVEDMIEQEWFEDEIPTDIPKTDIYIGEFSVDDLDEVISFAESASDGIFWSSDVLVCMTS